MTTADLHPSEYHSYYGRYINKLSEAVHLRDGLAVGRRTVGAFFEQLPEAKLTHRYAPDKWSIKEVFQHLIDTERIFAYRAFRIGRGDPAPLADFDQNLYVSPSQAQQKSRAVLLAEFVAVRDSSIALVNSFTDEDLRRMGVASGHPMSARAAAFTIIGHEVWHMDVINELYL